MDTDQMEQFAQHADKARSWVAHEFGLQPADAEDIVQDVLLRLGQWGPPRIQYPRAYLLKACARAAWRHKQWLKRWRSAPLDSDERCVTPKIREDQAHRNNPRLSKHSRRHRQVAHLIASGFTQVEAARELGLKPNTVRVYLHEIRKSLGSVAA